MPKQSTVRRGVRTFACPCEMHFWHASARWVIREGVQKFACPCEMQKNFLAASHPYARIRKGVRKFAGYARFRTPMRKHKNAHFIAAFSKLLLLELCKDLDLPQK